MLVLNNISILNLNNDNPVHIQTTLNTADYNNAILDLD